MPAGLLEIIGQPQKEFQFPRSGMADRLLQFKKKVIVHDGDPSWTRVFKDGSCLARI
jgi:hypothetical protein